jgi:hypothetical protein
VELLWVSSLSDMPVIYRAEPTLSQSSRASIDIEPSSMIVAAAPEAQGEVRPKQRRAAGRTIWSARNERMRSEDERHRPKGAAA